MLLKGIPKVFHSHEFWIADDGIKNCKGCFVIFPHLRFEQGSLNHLYGGGIKQYKCLVILIILPVIMHCLGLVNIMTPVEWAGSWVHQHQPASFGPFRAITIVSTRGSDFWEVPEIGMGFAGHLTSLYFLYIQFDLRCTCKKNDISSLHIQILYTDTCILHHLILHASWGWKSCDLKDSPIGRGVFFTWASGITPGTFNMDPKKWRFLEVGISFQQKSMTVHTFLPFNWRKCHIVHMYKSTSAFCVFICCVLSWGISRVKNIYIYIDIYISTGSPIIQHQHLSIHEVSDSWFTSFSLHRDFRFSRIDFEPR